MLDEYAAAAHLPKIQPASICASLGRQPEPRARTKDLLCFAFQRKTAQALARARWPGNVRQLELVIESAVVSALSDAIRAPDLAGEQPRIIPVGPKLVRDLLQAGDAIGTSSVSSSSEASGEDLFEVHLRHAASLRDVSRSVEIQYFETLYRRTDGDFAAMARRLLGDATPEASRKVRLRFNQLGLRVRGSKKNLDI